jgi:hypothetical protein
MRCCWCVGMFDLIRKKHSGPDHVLCADGCLQHMEMQHAEGQSPFVTHENGGDGHTSETATARSTNGNGRGNDQNDGAGSRIAESSQREEEHRYVECPVDGCGEVVRMDEMNFHLELHAEETVEDATAGGPDGEAVSQERRQRDHEQEKSSGVAAAVSSSVVSSSYAGDSRGHQPHLEKRHRQREQVSAKQQRAVFEWRKIFGMAFTPRSSPSKQSSQGTDSSSSDTPSKRLGVRRFSLMCPPLDSLPFWGQQCVDLYDRRKPNWESTHTRIKCQNGLSGCFRLAAK